MRYLAELVVLMLVSQRVSANTKHHTHDDSDDSGDSPTSVVDDEDPITTVDDTVITTTINNVATTIHRTSTTTKKSTSSVPETTTIIVTDRYQGSHPWSGMVGSVVTADATATTYNMICSKNDAGCSSTYSAGQQSLTLIAGPSVSIESNQILANGQTVVEKQGCTYLTDIYSCWEETTSGKSTTTSTITWTTASSEYTTRTVTIVSGVSKLFNTDPAPTETASTGTSSSSGMAVPTKVIQAMATWIPVGMALIVA